ncbi:response regulator transcription factor [Vulgatibacter incomptus]|uniref:Dna binding response regulator PrrA (RegA) n=1 Tax=Vulgatibacter incomptus TaxID=1391653 RepID=A0A0K1PDW0_9BACT|nr:response regulator [Vulgatibacter incomptus]AKU91304.1 Dna binding response regulator PrrA (RegA) [Vulgatibacter incomptus]
MKTSVLVVDDDEIFRNRLARALTERGLEVRTAGDGEEALRLAREESPEQAIVDLRMPGISGLDVVRGLHEIDPSTRILVLTGYGSIATAVAAVRLGAVDYLAKPADVEQIRAALDGIQADDAAPPGDIPSLARVEWEHIQRVLHDCGGNVSHAAKALGIHRRSLQRKLAKNPVLR